MNVKFRVNRKFAELIAAVILIVSGLRGTAFCQYSAEFSSYHDGQRYNFRISSADLEKTPEWQQGEPNPPLSPGKATLIGSEYLKSLFADSDRWTLHEITLHPVGDRWVYLITFSEPPPDGCRDCLSFPFSVVVKMDGTAVTATVSKWEPHPPK